MTALKPVTKKESRLRGRFQYPHDTWNNHDQAVRIARQRWKRKTHHHQRAQGKAEIKSQQEGAAAKVVNRLLEADDFPADQIAALAQQWFKRNARKLYDEHYELGFGIYRDLQGQLRAMPVERGEEVEIGFEDAPPEGGDPVGSLHTHVGSIGELSDFDREEGQKMADKLGHP